MLLRLAQYCLLSVLIPVMIVTMVAIALVTTVGVTLFLLRLAIFILTL